MGVKEQNQFSVFAPCIFIVSTSPVFMYRSLALTGQWVQARASRPGTPAAHPPATHAVNSLAPTHAHISHSQHTHTHHRRTLLSRPWTRSRRTPKSPVCFFPSFSNRVLPTFSSHLSME